MARYIAQYQFDATYTAVVFNEIKSYLEYEGFEYVNHNNENVFQKGKGLFVSPRFVKIGFNGNILQLETWMSYAILPDVFVGEFGLEGFFGWAAKGPMKKAVADIPMILQKYPLPQDYISPNSFLPPQYM